MMCNPTHISGCRYWGRRGLSASRVCARPCTLLQKCWPRKFTCCTPTRKQKHLVWPSEFADTSVNMHLFCETKAIAVSLPPECSTSPLSASSFNRQPDPCATVLFLLVWQRRFTALSLVCHCRANLFHLR